MRRERFVLSWYQVGRPFPKRFLLHSSSPSDNGRWETPLKKWERESTFSRKRSKPRWRICTLYLYCWKEFPFLSLSFERAAKSFRHSRILETFFPLLSCPKMWYFLFFSYTMSPSYLSASCPLHQESNHWVAGGERLLFLRLLLDDYTRFWTEEEKGRTRL